MVDVSRPQSQSIKISAVICSHKRVADLGPCLLSIARSAGRSSLSVVVCVNEKDEAEFQRVAAAGAICDPAAQFVHVPVLGLSNARNAGIQAARDSDWVVFLDDDTTVPPNWAEALRVSLTGTAADVGVVTGRVVPVWEKTVIHSRKWRNLLSLVEQTEPLTGTKVPGVGAFFCIRSSLALAVNGFDPNLGRTGKNLVGGEEMLLFARAVQYGFLLRFDPSVEVNHHIPEARCTHEWLRHRAFWEGVTQRQLGLVIGHGSSRAGAGISWLKSAAAGLMFLATQQSDLLVSTMWHFGFARANWIMKTEP